MKNSYLQTNCRKIVAEPIQWRGPGLIHHNNGHAAAKYRCHSMAFSELEITNNVDAKILFAMDILTDVNPQPSFRPGLLFLLKNSLYCG